MFPESVTSTSEGAVIVGSIKGIIYRAQPGNSKARAWIRPDATNGLQSVFGVLADERSKTLWVCSVPNAFEKPAKPDAKPSSVAAFDLTSGKFKASYSFPNDGGVCNDIAVAPNGAVYASDTPKGRILRLDPGAKALQLLTESESLKGIDGLVFDSDGTLYVNIVTRGAILRVERSGEDNFSITRELKVSRPLAGPDGFRLIEGKRFLLAEGTGGRIDEVTIDGDTATVKVLREGLNASPGVTRLGNVAYAIEGKIGYLIDPKLKGQDPGPFTLHAIPLN